MFTKRQYVDYLTATTGNYTCANLTDHPDSLWVHMAKQRLREMERQ